MQFTQIQALLGDGLECRALGSEVGALDMAALPLPEDYLPRGSGKQEKESPCNSVTY